MKLTVQLNINKDAWCSKCKNRKWNCEVKYGKRTVYLCTFCTFPRKNKVDKSDKK